MKLSIYLSIVLLALYGDIVKRLSPGRGLQISYLVAISILLSIALRRKRKDVIHSRDAMRVNTFVLMLIATYAFQLVTSAGSLFAYGVQHFLYMAIPLSFIVAIERYIPQFDLLKLGRIFLVLMIPINIVALIQYFINPSFLISFSYSETGGFIERNYLLGGTFTRYPSIFASADRYSAMALMQFFFSIILLNEQGIASGKRNVWVVLNLFMSFVALGIAGARSRILIAFVEISILAVMQLVPLLRPARFSVHRRAFMAFLVFLFTITSFFCLIYSSVARDKSIIVMLRQTLEEDDVYKRVHETGTMSRIPRDVSFFGAGLGTESAVPGKPGELGIRAMWRESGLIWGGLLMFFFMGIVITLFKLSFRFAIKCECVLFVTCSLPLLILINGLLSGLTAAFELSTGLMLACTIAVAVQTAPADKFGGWLWKMRSCQEDATRTVS